MQSQGDMLTMIDLTTKVLTELELSITSNSYWIQLIEKRINAVEPNEKLEQDKALLEHYKGRNYALDSLKYKIKSFLLE